LTAADLYASLAKERLGVLGTIGPTGKPQSALVGIAITPQLEIVFDTVKSSRKYLNLHAQPACTFVTGGWGTTEQTIQYEGVAEELKSPALGWYQEIYFQAWPDGPARMRWPGIVYFVVRPTWIRYSDFDQDPPVKFEWQASKGGLTTE
jgi:pyridoxine/pyridoxamine 5'-phosphate oxidase